MPLAAGSRLGVYEVMGPLGEGGMGAVYKARDTRLNRLVAIKVVSEALAGDQALRARFEQEARAVAALNHPHICTIHDVGREGDIDYLVLELLDGETLAARIARAPMDVAEAVDVAMQIGDALDAAHRAGIVHRDLKPGNVMLVRATTKAAPTAKLLDFGVAAPGATQASAADASLLATMPASMAATRSALANTPLSFSGTVQYMAPEQMELGVADTRSDIFAFGCVLYEMLAGRKAFEGASAAAVIGAVMGSEPPPVERLRGEPLLEHLLRRCLAKDRERRWQSIRDVADMLRFISTGAATAGAAPPVPPARSAAGTAARTAAIIVLAIVSTLAIISALFLVRRPRGGAGPAQFEVTTPPTDEASVALSPDGQTLAFIANQNRQPMLWLRSINKIDTRPLPNTEGAHLPFWSPQGTSLAFFADGKLKRIDLTSGATMVLADAPNGRGGDWGKDGTILFAPNVSSAIYRIPARGGDATAITKPDLRSSHRRPQFLPDGTHFLFLSSLGQAEKNGIYFGTLNGGSPVRLFAADAGAVFAPPNRLLVARDRALVAYTFNPDTGTVSETEPITLAQAATLDRGLGGVSASMNGSIAYRSGGGQMRRLVWVDPKGTELAVVGDVAADDVGSPELSVDDKTAAVFLRGARDNDVAVVDLARGLRRFITNTPPADAHPIWDPDGKHLVFTASRFGNALSPARVSIDGGVPQPLFARPMKGVVLSWTKDRGAMLLRREEDKTGADLVGMTPDGEETPVAASAFDETEGQFSPDGRWVAFVSNESGRPEVYLQSYPGATGRTQVSIAGGNQVRWAADGSHIFYVAPDGKMMSAGVALSAAATDVTRAVPLFQTYLATGTNVIGNKPQYAVARDGRFLLNVIVETPSAPIVVSIGGTR